MTTATATPNRLTPTRLPPTPRDPPALKTTCRMIEIDSQGRKDCDRAPGYDVIERGTRFAVVGTRLGPYCKPHARLMARRLSPIWTAATLDRLWAAIRDCPDVHADGVCSEAA